MISSWFPVGRGCRQGDPIAPYLVLLCSKILAHVIRKDPDIKGYSINDIEIKVNQFADDTSLFCFFLGRLKKSPSKCISVLHKFSTLSGLKMNLDKIKCIWFGFVRPPESIVARSKLFILVNLTVSQALYRIKVVLKELRCSHDIVFPLRT